MIFNLLEDNKSVENIIHHLDVTIVKLRESGKLDNNPELVKMLKKIYKQQVLIFQEKYFLFDKEIPKNEEEELTNIILETIHTLNKIK